MGVKKMADRVRVDAVIGKPRNFDGYLCRSLYSTLQHLSNHMHYITVNGYKRFFIDQLVQSKATCSFKISRVF